jgi:hypothetical protein
MPRGSTGKRALHLTLSDEGEEAEDGESTSLDYEIDPCGCQSEHGTQTINVLPSHMRDHDAPTLETRLGVRLRPQSMDKRFIETSPLVPSIQGFPPLLA